MGSATDIAEAIVTNLSAASAFGSGAVSRGTYAVLERTSSSAAVVSLVGCESAPATFGSPRDRNRTWTFRVTVYLKDTGDPDALLKRIYTAADTVIPSLEADETLQGKAEVVNEIMASYTPGEAVEAGGAVWLPISFDLVVTEFT